MRLLFIVANCTVCMCGCVNEYERQSEMRMQSERERTRGEQGDTDNEKADFGERM